MAITLTRTPTSGTRLLAVDFTSSPAESGTWVWDFGDGSASTLASPTHVYVKAGTYTVTLTMGGEVGTTTVTVTDPTTPVEPLSVEMWIDWDADGQFETTDTHNDDVSAYLREVNIERGAQFDLLGGQSPGTATVVLGNTDGRFSPSNSSGPYYGFLKPGKRAWIGMKDANSVTYGLFAGYIEEIAPVPGTSQRVQMILKDAFAMWQVAPIEVAFNENLSVSDFRGAVLDALGVSYYRRFLDNEPDGLLVCGIKSDNGLAVLEEINKSFVSRHWIEPASNRNNFYFYCAINRNRNLGDSYGASVSANDIVAMDGYRLTRETVVNHLSVTYSPVRWLTSAPGELWRSEDPVAMKQGTTTVVLRFSTWVKNLTVTCSFDNTTYSPTAFIYNFGREAVIVLTDSGGTNTARGLLVKGVHVAGVSYEPLHESEDTDSQAEYGKRSGGSTGGELIQSAAVAQAVGDSVIARSKDPRPRPTVRFRNRYDKWLVNGLHTVVRQSLPELGMTNEQFEIIGSSAHLMIGGVHEFSWTYLATTIADATSIDLFTIGTSQIGGTDVLGF